MKITFTKALDAAISFTLFTIVALIAYGYFEGRFDSTEVARMVIVMTVFIVALEINRIRRALDDMNKRKE